MPAHTYLRKPPPPPLHTHKERWAFHCNLPAEPRAGSRGGRLYMESHETKRGRYHRNPRPPPITREKFNPDNSLSHLAPNVPRRAFSVVECKRIAQEGGRIIYIYVKGDQFYNDPIPIVRSSCHLSLIEPTSGSPVEEVRTTAPLFLFRR